MKKLCIIIGLIMIIGCGGGGDDSAAPGIGTRPVIHNVMLTDEDFQPKSEFEVGDKANFMVTATDPDKNMDELIIEQYFPADSEGNPFYGPNVVMLPSQSYEFMDYMLISDTIVDGPPGDWRLEFQIADSTGLESNVFTVFAIVTADKPVITDLKINNCDLDMTEFYVDGDLCVEVRVVDPDRVVGDLPLYIGLNRYLLSFSEDTPYWEPSAHSLNPTFYHSTTDIEYSAFLTTKGPAGDWRYEFKIIDQAGDISDTVSEYITIDAEMKPCEYLISPTSKSFPASGGSNETITVTVDRQDCNVWTYMANDDWITIVGSSKNSGTGNGTVLYSVSANTTASTRTGTITVAGETYTVFQDGAP